MDDQRFGWKLVMATFGAWLISCALLVVDSLLVRGAFFTVVAWLGARLQQSSSALFDLRWALEFVDWLLWLILVCVGVALAVAFEYYYRQGAEKGLLGKRVRRVMGIQLAVALISWMLQTLL